MYFSFMYCILADTLNTQVHEATKQMPYELVFGQSPMSMIVPDPSFKGRIDKKDLQDRRYVLNLGDQTSQQESSQGEVDQVTKQQSD